MDIRTLGPLRAASLVWQPRASTWALTIISKATFVLRPGESALAPEQEDISRHEDHWNDDPDRSVRVPCDLVPGKPRADVSLVGHAFVPSRGQTRRLMVRVIVGDIDKSIEITCDRVIGSDGTIQEGARFHRMAIGYERTAGGAGTTNPAGVRIDVRDMYGRRPLPNLQRPDAHISSITDVIEPIGFGPIGQSWPARLRLVGNSADNIPALVSPLMLPEGFDLAYYNHAPADQQLATLRDNERIVLENLHPEHPRLATSLPGLRPIVFIQGGRLHGQRINMRPDTLWIDTDRAIATLTFRGQVPIANPEEPGLVLVAMQEPGADLTFVDLERMLGPATKDPPKREVQEQTVVGFDPSKASGALPFNNENPWSESTVTLATMQPTASGAGSHSPTWLAQGAQSAAPAPSGPPAAAPRPAAGVPAATRGPAFLAPSAPAPAPAAKFAVPPSSPVVPPAPTSSPSAAPVPAPKFVPPRPVVLPSQTPLGQPATSAWAASTGGNPAVRETVGTMAAAAAATAVTTTPDGAQSGAVAASNAAAGTTAAPWDASWRDRKPVAQPEVQVEPEQPRKELIHLLWFDPSIPSRLRRVPRWKPVLDELEDSPPDRSLDGAAMGHDPGQVDDMREVFEIMAHGARSDARGLDDAMAAGTREDGKFLPPLVLVTGELEVCFDELATLKAAIALSSPLVTATDESLKAAIASARELLAADPDLPAVVAEAATKRIHEAFVREKKALPPEHLDGQIDRLLLSSRSYQKRVLFGDTFLRTQLTLAAGGQPAIVYLPADLAKKLPMFRRFRARVISEVHPAQDASETNPRALRGFALARTTPQTAKV